MRAVSPEEVTAGAEALVRWCSPPHRAAAQAVLVAAHGKRAEREPDRIPLISDPRAGIPTKTEGGEWSERLTAEHVGWLILLLVALACGVIIGWQV